MRQKWCTGTVVSMNIYICIKLDAKNITFPKDIKIYFTICARLGIPDQTQQKTRLNQIIASINVELHRREHFQEILVTWHFRVLWARQEMPDNR